MTKLFSSGGVVELATSSQNVITAPANPAVLHSFSVGNVDGVNAATFDLEFFDDSLATTVLFAKDIPVGAGGAFALNTVFNLEALDAFKAKASVNGDLSFLSSFIERSNPTGKTFKNTGAIAITTVSTAVLTAPADKPAVLYSLAIGSIAGTGGGSATVSMEFVDNSGATTKQFLKNVNVNEATIFTFDGSITLEANDQLKISASANSKLVLFGSYMEVDNVA